jgi:hypothetical protein
MNACSQSPEEMAPAGGNGLGPVQWDTMLAFGAPTHHEISKLNDRSLRIFLERKANFRHVNLWISLKPAAVRSLEVLTEKGTGPFHSFFE